MDKQTRTVNFLFFDIYTPTSACKILYKVYCSSKPIASPSDRKQTNKQTNCNKHEYLLNSRATIFNKPNQHKRYLQVVVDVVGITVDEVDFRHVGRGEE